MTGMVTVAVAGDVMEAEEIQGVLAGAGIQSAREAAEGEVPGAATLGDGPCRILVPQDVYESALSALEESDEAADDDAW